MDGRARELDLIAYRAVTNKDLEVVSAVLASCKKDMESLPNRAKNKKRLYHFTLLSIVDAPLVDVFYKGNSPTVTEIDGITHLPAIWSIEESCPPWCTLFRRAPCPST